MEDDMNLAQDRFYDSWVLHRGADGVLRNMHQFTYETHNALYDVLVFEGAKFYRKNCGALSNLISSITPIHYAIENHFSI